MKFSIYKTIAGAVRVKHQCPHCSEAIENEIAEAGHPDSCPACGKTFVVPGKAQREKLEADLARAREDKRRREADVAAERQAKAKAEAEAEEAKRRAQAQAIDVNPEGNMPPPVFDAYVPPFKPLPPKESKRKRYVSNTVYPALELYRTLFRLLGILCVAVFLALVAASIVITIVYHDARIAGHVISLLIAGASILPLALVAFVSAQFIQLALDARRDLARLVELASDQKN